MSAPIPRCKDLACHAARFYRRKNAAGAWVIQPWCRACQARPGDRSFYSARLFTPEQIEAMPEARPLSAGVCARCSAVGPVEEHHWAPRHLFADADQWPVDDLCGACHRRWHEVIAMHANMRRGGV